MQGETGLHQSHQAIDRQLLIAAVSDDPDIGAAHNAEGQDTQQALRIHAAFFLLHPDRGFVLVGLLDKERGGTGMQTDLVLHQHFFDVH